MATKSPPLEDQNPRYRTWIRGGRILGFWAAAIVGLGLGGLGWIHPWLGALGLLGLPFLYIALIISLTAFRFSPRGGDWQSRIHRLVIEGIPLADSVLDIGCGSGKMAILVAKENPGCRVVGLDSWGKEWEYSLAQSQANARLEGVQVQFVQGSATHLSFPDHSFQTVVSCLTFHEVSGISDRNDLLVEALRVLAPGGTFSFLDLFAHPRRFAGIEAMRSALERAGARVTSIDPIPTAVSLPFPLGSPQVLGFAVLIRGTKPLASQRSVP